MKIKTTLIAVRTLVVTLITFGSLVGVANSALIVNNINAPSSAGGTNDYGQSFTISATSAWNNLTFNFLSSAGNPASSPFAAGSLYLLDAAYLGTQGGLSSSTPGFIAQTSDITNGMWRFAPSVTVTPSKQYWIYTQGDVITPVAFSSSNPYAGGFAYQDIGSGYQAVTNADFGFSFEGTAVPEASSALLFCLGALGIVVRRQRIR